jgi:ribosomal protein S20
MAQVRDKKPSTHAVWQVEGRSTRGKTLPQTEENQINPAERLLRDVAQKSTGTRQEDYDDQDIRVAITKTCPARLRNFSTLCHLTTRIKAWAAGLLEMGLDFDTALNALLTLSAVLTEAVEDGLITHNPALRSANC